MRIGIMLRAYDRPGGIGIYSRNIVRHLLKLDERNPYVLFYNNPAHVGTYAGRANVEEVCIQPCNQLAWDQVHIPRAIRRHGIDLVFNTKFSVPLATRAKRVMVLHGASWYTHPELYHRLDILYVRAAMPVYCRAADFLISNSDLTTTDFKRLLRVPDAKIETVRLAAGDAFKPVTDPQALEAIRRKYDLPERFVLTVTSYDPRKNFETLVNAFELCRNRGEDIHLVVIGKDCERYAADFSLERRAIDRWVRFPGWVEQDDLPAIYSMAAAFGFPSIYEEFGIPVVEAMACGCPVVASDTGAIPELTEGAALLANPFDDKEFAENLMSVITMGAVRDECRRRGLARAKDFSWDRAARRTLEIFEEVGNRP